MYMKERGFLHESTRIYERRYVVASPPSARNLLWYNPVRPNEMRQRDVAGQIVLQVLACKRFKA